MEWNGMEWNGMEWNGMEWNGMEWNGMEWNGTERNRMEGRGKEWNTVVSPQIGHPPVEDKPVALMTVRLGVSDLRTVNCMMEWNGMEIKV
jgi:hypothetical protein